MSKARTSSMVSGASWSIMRSASAALSKACNSRPFFMFEELPTANYSDALEPVGHL